MFGSESGVVEHSLIHAKSPIMCLPLHPAILGNMFKNCGRQSLLASHFKDKPVEHISAGGRGSGAEPFLLEAGALSVESGQGHSTKEDGQETFALGQTSSGQRIGLSRIFPLRIRTDIYISPRQGCRSQQKVIPRGGLPRESNGVLIPNINFTAETGWQTR